MEKTNMKFSFFGPKAISSLPLPLFSSVKAGFPSPADDHMEERLDLNQFLIKHPAATFFVRVEGESMQKAGIREGDILIVDRALQPREGSIVIALLEGEFTVKRIKVVGKTLYLVPENPAFPLLKVGEESDFQVWGVVTYVIHAC